jgi:VCBS repeat-containing protein
VEVDLDGHPFANAFSLDGRRFAAWVPGPGDSDPGHLVVVDVATGEARNGRGAVSGAYGNLTWSADGDWVFVLARGDDPTPELVAYQLAAGRATTRVVPELQTGAIVAVRSVDGPDLEPASATERCPEVGGLDHNTNPLPALTTDRACRLDHGP